MNYISGKQRRHFKMLVMKKGSLGLRELWPVKTRWRASASNIRGKLTRFATAGRYESFASEDTPLIRLRGFCKHLFVALNVTWTLTRHIMDCSYLPPVHYFVTDLAHPSSLFSFHIIPSVTLEISIFTCWIQINPRRKNKYGSIFASCMEYH